MGSENKLDKGQVNAIIALIIGIVGTWALPKFFLIPWFNLFGIQWRWWMYIILFIMCSGMAFGTITKQEAYHQMAYKK